MTSRNRTKGICQAVLAAAFVVGGVAGPASAQDAGTGGGTGTTGGNPGPAGGTTVRSQPAEDDGMDWGWVGLLGLLGLAGLRPKRDHATHDRSRANH